MRELPILFKGPLVRAILDGRKTQTRRLLKPQPPTVEDVRARTGTGFRLAQPPGHAPGSWAVYGPAAVVRDLCGQASWRCPYGEPGDLLWVRETHAIATGHMYDGEAAVKYRADDALVALHDERSNSHARNASISDRWRPSIHMPRWASRLTLRVTEVRVERLTDISDADALAEGVDPYECPSGPACPSPRGAFFELWDKVNGERAPWRSNPWVWVVVFERVT